MSSLQLNIRWNRYETALLVEAYEKVSQKVISRKDAVAQLSKQLRKGSAAMGLSISDTFRNENGIGMQMTVIKNILTNSDSSFSSSSKVFLEVCNLYLNDKQSYGQILERAKKMYPSNNADRLKTYAPVDEEEVQVIADPLTNSDKKKSYIRNVYNKISNKIKIGFSTQSTAARAAAALQAMGGAFPCRALTSRPAGVCRASTAGMRARVTCSWDSSSATGSTAGPTLWQDRRTSSSIQ